MLEVLLENKLLISVVVIAVIIIIWALTRNRKIRSFVPFMSKSSIEMECDELADKIKEKQSAKK